MEVDVEGRVGAPAQGLFHGDVIVVGGPGGVGGAVGGAECECDAVFGVGVLQVGELVLDHGRRYVVGVGCLGCGRVGDDVEVGVDVEEGGGLALGHSRLDQSRVPKIVVLGFSVVKVGEAGSEVFGGVAGAAGARDGVVMRE